MLCDTFGMNIGNTPILESVDEKLMLNKVHGKW